MNPSRQTGATSTAALTLTFAGLAVMGLSGIAGEGGIRISAWLLGLGLLTAGLALHARIAADRLHDRLLPWMAFSLAVGATVLLISLALQHRALLEQADDAEPTQFVILLLTAFIGGSALVVAVTLGGFIAYRLQQQSQ
ncbi:hypothetical protein [Plantibacter sp. YIM 135249]|uniref:hypothetical protein n=1 Tax=Plantibacter sp. YIM 135249 TaxID=3423918 RepID=UPI003D32ECFD